MSEAHFQILQAGPLVTFQDGGRPGQMRYGVPSSGPMDRVSFSAANLALGQPADSTAIEISIGGLSLECVSGEVTFAVNGGEFVFEIDGTENIGSSISTVKAGQTLTIRPGKRGNWCYLAFAGELDAPKWIGSTATHSASGFGGGNLKANETVSVKSAVADAHLEGSIPPFTFRPYDGYARVVLGPQDHHFLENAVVDFTSSEFRLSTNYDRMGSRLEGPVLGMRDVLSIPSEPLMRGSVQVSGEGVPTILMADHQTTGGYPKIATVVSSDLDQIAQLRPRDKLRFKVIEPSDAIGLARTRNIELRYYFASLS